MNKLYSMSLHYGRSGVVTGLFIADEKEVELAEGKEVYFGEILGKHSEVECTFEDCNVIALNVSEECVEELLSSIGNSISGYNPLNYIIEYCFKCGEPIRIAEEEYEVINGEILCWGCGRES